MIKTPMDVQQLFPVRKSKRQKQAFRDEIQSYAKSLGYECTIEKGSFGSHNVVIGNPEEAKYLVTAHYDTCARLPFPNLITPCNFWTFIGYQLFVTLLIFASVGIGGSIVYFLSRDGFWAYWTGYMLIWVFLALLMIGPANKNNANDNTSGVVTVLEIAKDLPDNYRSRVCFVLFDLEEAGLIGSSCYRSKHKKASENQIILNLDCVGDGDDILFFPTKKLRKDEKKMLMFRRICGKWGRKSISLREKGFSMYPSDQGNFPCGVGIAALRHTKSGILYCTRIHTKKDTILEQTNVNILRASLITLVTGPAAE